ncbi:class I SAM-dependent methyltransferase [Lachancea thermotolerans CBS 6340]|uniref:KLTH0H09460p n=1 Tax=Lachancea thermotolerans (strain ATCC 56472 / CBS 6340 / NRRL Y-8284) TaxID=559295 RepID=C5E313_LACTC|nr:KLTH0H09460p [Lachancea thermotolerans CBS 6340]CAR30424.1 KLTH0H09460p [Lachancea thermotolerans CBS 6340]
MDHQRSRPKYIQLTREMSTYSENSFNSDFYQEKRPRYPESLYQEILSYHSGDLKLAIDVGCGTGISTLPLLKSFERVVGCDPSSTMLESAKKFKDKITVKDINRIEYSVCGAEDLTSLFASDSIDLVTGAESIHWVDEERFFKQAFQVLKPNGTLAYWFYVEPIFIEHPQANEIYEEFVYEDPAYMGPQWKPGKEKLRVYGEQIRIPEDKFTDIERHVYRPLVSKEKTAYFYGRDSMTVDDLRQYLRSWSAYHTWQQKFGEKGCDVAELLLDELKSKCGWDEANTRLKVEWGTAYYLARKKATTK